MRFRYILVLMVGATVLAACGTKVGELKPEDIMVFDYFDRTAGFNGILVNVNAGVTELEIRKRGEKACTGNVNGCLRIKRGNRANIEFRLADADWYFKELSLCKGTTKPTAACSLKRHERRDFDARASKSAKPFFTPDPDGNIDLGQVGTKPTKFVLHIENSIRQDYFYNIEACNDLLAKCLSLDPRIKNRGR